MPATPYLTFLLDVDNTLLDNDAAKAELGRRLVAHLGEAEAERFWVAYEEVRAEAGLVSYPLTLARFWAEAPPGAAPTARREREVALADLVVAFPYADFVYPGAIEAIAHLRALGRVAILSDGDPAYQPTKIARAGLDPAVDGFVLVYAHKQEHMVEVTATLPADRFVLVEDKPDNISQVRAALAELGLPLTGILVRQGKYAAKAGSGSGPWAGAEHTLDRIGDLRGLGRDAFLGPTASDA
jgi:FMN phosphatase YigB (HAD superfamily)